MSGPDLFEMTMVDCLTPDLKRLTREHFWMASFREYGCTMAGFEDKGIIPDLPMERHPVFRTSEALGTLKNDGYQYPSCLVDGERLLIGYSVNKEDMEVGIVDTKAL